MYFLLTNQRLKDLMCGAIYENGSIYFWDVKAAKVVISGKLHSEPGSIPHCF